MSTLFFSVLFLLALAALGLISLVGGAAHFVAACFGIDITEKA